MPKIHDFGGFSIKIYFRDHNPPHFHVVGPDFYAQVSIDDTRVLAGTLSPKVERQVRRWAAANHALLAAAWATYRQGR